MTERDRQYKKLVNDRQGCDFCKREYPDLWNQHDMINPFNVKDKEGNYPDRQYGEINAWTIWQGNKDADILVIGQDWGPVNLFKASCGRDPPNGKFRTNPNIAKLFSHAISSSIDIHDLDNKDPRLFFTNAMLCLKGEGKAQGEIDEKILKICVERFTKSLISIIQPAVVVTMGNGPFRAVLKAFQNDEADNLTDFREIVNSPPAGGFKIEWEGGSSAVFPVFHCGSLGLNINRCRPEMDHRKENNLEKMTSKEKWDVMSKDWERIGTYASQHSKHAT
jgi:DNA polymerase